MIGKLKNAPVFFTIAQVRFNPILNMESYLPAIQDKMRSGGFPDFRREAVQQLVLPITPHADDGKPPNPAFTPIPRFIFGDINQTTEFALVSDALSLLTTEYDTSKAFIKTFLDGLGYVHNILRLEFVSRIGLRYFDAVIPEDGDQVAAYLAPEVLGLSQKLEGTLVHSFNETVSVTQNGHLVSRAIIRDGKIGLPPDLLEYAARIKEKFKKKEGRHAILDTDAFSDRREVFSMDKVSKKLHDLHNDIRSSFEATVTEYALRVWR